METLTININPDMANIKVLHEAVDAFLENNHFPRKTRFCIKLALEEAVANIIEHGRVEGQIHIQCQHNKEKIRIQIEDKGTPFDPTTIARPDTVSRLEDRKPGGLGIYFIQHYMDVVDYQYQDHKNVLTLIKYLEK